MKQILLIVILAVAVLVAGRLRLRALRTRTPEPDEPVEYTLVWQDEFDGPVDQSPDADNWVFDVGGTRLGQRAARVRHGPGRERLPGRRRATCASSPARKTTGGPPTPPAASRPRASSPIPTGASRPGSSCPSARASGRRSGCWATNFETVGWPDLRRDRHHGVPRPDAERGQRRPARSRLLGRRRRCTAATTTRARGFNEDFHVFAVEWTPELHHLAGRRPDLHDQGRRRTCPRGTDWVFDHPFFIILNVAVGGNYVGSPDETTVFPQTMLVDYVRVYAAN